MGDVLRIENEGRVRTLVLNRPEKKNALSHELADIVRAFATHDATEARRAFFEKRAPEFEGR